MHKIELTNTYKEIFQQPDVWLKEYKTIIAEKNVIKNFISKHNISKESKIILCGAGTSAFIGDVLSVTFSQKGFKNCKAVSTTDLITNPEAYLIPSEKQVIVSFARSGNSPESLAAVKLANSICKEAIHIIITCNKNGALAVNADPERSLLLLLPPETNDASLAMTSSFSTMTLACMLLMNIENIDEQAIFVNDISNNAKNLLTKYESPIRSIAGRKFNRAIFLGSGELKGIAEECHLKLQELTDGKVMCKFDSFLGFRHGPKAVINENSVIVYLFSGDKYSLRYEKDLVKQINSNNNVVAQISVSKEKVEIPNVKFDLEICISHNPQLDNEYYFIPYVFVGQLLGLFKSSESGLDPDNPSVSGNISRVVEGVTIYDYNN